ncbi:hypothetical protein AAG906_007623 [Vitis piasezkii]
MEDTEEFNSNNNRPRPPVQGQRTMRELLNPPRLSTPSCFMLPPNHDHVTIRPQVEPSRDRTMNRARASGVYTLPEGLDVQAKLVTVMRRLDDLEAKGVQEVQIVNDGVTQLCLICNSSKIYAVKRRIKLSKKAFLIEQVGAIIENKAMVKYKDPDSFVERALLDLGASVNLLPYSIYKQLGLGELKATTITLSLADRSIKVPRGVVKMFWCKLTSSTTQWTLWC